MKRVLLMIAAVLVAGCKSTLHKELHISIPAQSEAQNWEPEKTFAIIVGVLEWKNDLAPFPKRNRKDQELKERLIKCGTPTENITILLDQDATLVKISKAITHTLSRTSEDSTLIIYYAGHGWAAGNDFCFANYDVQSGRKDTSWSMNELAATVAKEFKGRRAFFWADCCYSGGMKVIVDKLAARGAASFSLTSATTTNTSTRNWTFTQSLLDGLSGSPLIDTDRDGLITLGELKSEVRDAMNHLENQKYGFKVNGFGDTFMLTKTRGRLADDSKNKYQIGSYVIGKGKYGRVVGVKDTEAGEYLVQFYDYTEKIVKLYAERDLVASMRKQGISTKHRSQITRIEPDCIVEWRGAWYDAKVISKKPGYWYIRYVDDDESWNEWVGPDRIRFKGKPAATRE